MDKIADAFSLIRNGANIKQGLDDSGYPITRIETISNRTVDRDKMGYEQVPLTRFYFLRSFAKKPSASLRMSFAVRSSETSRSSSRMRMDCSSALSVFAGGAFRRMLRQSASV
jgi:hypothetical protein